MIEEDRLPAFAVWHETFRVHLQKGLFDSIPDHDEANVSLEAWNYNPVQLTQADMVDPLSLYLSLQDSPEERIQQQLEQLLEKVPW